jgi:hypothetical protein
MMMSHNNNNNNNNGNNGNNDSKNQSMCQLGKATRDRLAGGGFHAEPYHCS